MDIIITAKNLEFTESMRVLVEKKMKGLGKLVDGYGTEEKKLFVEIEKESKHHRKGGLFRTEAIIKLPGENLLSLSHATNLAGAVVKARQEMERKIRKHKTKTIDLPRRRYRRVKRETI